MESEFFFVFLASSVIYVTMSVSDETKLNKDLRFSYKSFGSSSELADGSSADVFTKNHEDGSPLKGNQGRTFV